MDFSFIGNIATQYGGNITTAGLAVSVMWYALNKSNENITNITGEIKDGFDKIAMFVGTTQLTSNQVIDICRNRVWFASEAKLIFLRGILEKNNLIERRSILKEQIKTELINRSMEYIQYLNQYSIKTGLAGDYINDNFDMDNFLLEIYDVMFRGLAAGKTERECIERKMNDIRFIMMKYQSQMFEQMRKDLAS